MSLDKVCFIIVKRNELNRKRHRMYKKISEIEIKITNSRHCTRSQNVYLSRNQVMDLEDKIAHLNLDKNAIRRHIYKITQSLAPLYKELNIVAQYGGSGGISSIRNKKTRNKIVTKDGIQERHDAYIAEMELLNGEDPSQIIKKILEE